MTLSTPAAGARLTLLRLYSNCIGTGSIRLLCGFRAIRRVALDITQETFLKLLSKIGEFRGEASFESWLYRLVVNGCLDHRRAGRRWSPLLDGWLGALRASGESVLQQLLRSEVQENVQQVVAKLPPELRIVVILRYTEQLSYDEIAEILGCPQGTVASRLNRAHKLLERRLAGLRNTLGGNHA